MTTTSRSSRPAQLLRETIQTLVVFLVAFVLLRGVIQNFRIEGESMEPTLHPAQYLLVNKLAYVHADLNAPLRLLPGKADLPKRVIYPFDKPRRGDIVIFRSPVEDRDYIKRVVGLPGEHVAITAEGVLINGKRLHEPYVLGTTSCLGPVEHCSLVVPPDAVYVLGDNRAVSSDSRSWRALPFEQIIGRAWVSYWPLQQWGVIPGPSYALDGEE